MEERLQLKLIFFSYKWNKCQFDSYRLSFESEDALHEVKEDKEITHPLFKEIFKYELKKRIFIELFNSKGEKINTIYFNIYYGDNSAYFQRQGKGEGYHIEIDFQNYTDLKINKYGYEFKTLDNNKTKNRQKITILNYNNISIDINNDEEINIKIFI